MANNGYAALRRLGNFTIALTFAGSTLLALPAQAQEPLRIVALGDSLTAGYGLAPGDGLVPQLEAWLTARGHAVVIENAGVSGDTTAGGLSRVDWALGGNPQAMILTLGGNDMLRGLPPESVRTNLDAILEKAAARNLPVLLVGMRAPGNWGPEYKQQFDAIYPELAEKHGALLMPDFFAGYAAAGANSADPASYAAFMQGDGIHPNAEGVKLIITRLGPEVETLLGRINRPL